MTAALSRSISPAPSTVRYEVRYIGSGRMILSVHKTLDAAIRARRPRENSKIVAVGEAAELAAMGAVNTMGGALVLPGPDARTEWIECEARR